MQKDPSASSSQKMASNNNSNVPTPPKAKKTSKLKPIVFGVVGLIVLIVLLVCAYLFWYQNPQKVLTDAVANTVTAKQVASNGLISFTDKKNEVKINYDAASVGKTGKADMKIDVKFQEMNLKATIQVLMAENADVYIKASDLRKTVDGLVDQYIDSMGANYDFTEQQRADIAKTFHEQFDPIVKKIDGQWIVIKAGDMKNDEADKVQTCLRELTTLLKEDKSATQELRSAYSNNQFMIIEKLGSKDGALGYEISLDKDKAKAFGEATKDSKIAKKIQSCSDDKKASATTKADDDDTSVKKVEVWVQRWSHNLKQVAVELNQDGAADIALEMNFDYSKPVEVNTPKDAMTADELSREIESLTAVTGAI